jgi:hypothetical protein
LTNQILYFISSKLGNELVNIRDIPPYSGIFRDIPAFRVFTTPILKWVLRQRGEKIGRCENPECRNITEYGGISRNMAEYHGIFRNITEYGGITRNITTFSRNIPEHHNIFRW